MRRESEELWGLQRSAGSDAGPDLPIHWFLQAGYQEEGVAGAGPWGPTS